MLADRLVDSPIYSFYPEDFEIDMNGKKNDWEGIVLVPFIDQNALVAAAASIPNSQLSKEEFSRNQFGSAYIYQYHKDHTCTVRSPLQSLFQDLTHCAR